MSVFSLLVLLLITVAVVLVIRSIVGVFRRTASSPTSGFPTFSVCMLSISLILLIVGTWVSLQINDAIGNALSTTGGFFGLLESHVRHKREALVGETVEDDVSK